jgi:hypothetical protein
MPYKDIFASKISGLLFLVLSFSQMLVSQQESIQRPISSWNSGENLTIRACKDIFAIMGLI